nr:putative wax ester synthase/acyl-CoA:diacylglycerol acyltransferase [uncultured bacterium]
MAEKLSGIDSSFLALENATCPMHVMGVLLLDPEGMDGGYSFDTLIGMLTARIHLMPQLRRRLVQAPFDLDHGRWIEDPDFDVARHVRRVDAGATATETGTVPSWSWLEGLVGAASASRLDRTRPLWEMIVVEGVTGLDGTDGLVAVVTKMHHAIIDGVSGADLMVHMFDLSAEVRDVEPPDEAWVGEDQPSSLLMLGDAVVNQVTNPIRLIGELAKSAGSLATSARSAVGKRKESGLGLTAPAVPWTGALSERRSVALGRSSLDDMKTIKAAYACKINDVILAATTLALRDYLIWMDALPDRPLAAAVPIALQRPEGEERRANELATMLSPLPVQLEDPVEVLHVIAAATRASKELVHAVGAPNMMEWAGFTAPRLLNVFSGLYAKLRLADLHPPIQNVVVSNVPGPPLELWVAGAKVVGVFPMGPVLPGAGLNLTILSNMGNVDLGIMADAETVPEVHRIADGFTNGVQQLLASIAAD